MWTLWKEQSSPRKGSWTLDTPNIQTLNITLSMMLWLVYCASEDMIAALGVVDSFGFPCLSTSLPSFSDMHVLGLELGFGGLITLLLHTE